MTSSAKPGAAGANRERKGDARQRLFALQVDLFASAPARDRESVRAFEALALGFMPRLDPATLATAAERLAPCPDTPPAVLDFLVRFSARTRAAVLAGAPTLPPGTADLVIGLGRAAALAARPGLDAALQERLVAMEEPFVDEALAGNPGMALSGAALRSLVARAADRPLLGRALLARADLSPADEAALYLSADRARRASILARIEADATTRHPALPPLAPEERDTLLAHAEAGAVAAFSAQLAACLGLQPATRWSFLRRDRQDLLGLALAALRVDEPTAARIALALHPAIGRSQRAGAAIVAIAGSVTPETAAALLEAILGQVPNRTGLASARRVVRAVPPAADRSAGEASRLAG